jgi:hypothetical protein
LAGKSRPWPEEPVDPVEKIDVSAGWKGNRVEGTGERGIKGRERMIRRGRGRGEQWCVVCLMVISCA